MGNKTDTKGYDVEGKGLELITITNGDGKEIQLDKKIFELAIKNGITIDKIFDKIFDREEIRERMDYLDSKVLDTLTVLMAILVGSVTTSIVYLILSLLF